MLWGVRLNRALRATTGNALCMHWVRCGGCAVGHRRDTSRYACGNPASTSLFSARPSHQKAGHRAIAQVVPRAGVVNARRPGRRPGRSEAKSIDDAEHGASMNSAMVRQRDLDPQNGGVPSGKQWDAREPISVRFVGRIRSGGSGHEHVHAGGAFVLHDLCAQTATCGTTNDGVNDPVSTRLGSLAQGRTAGSFTPSLVHRLRHRHRR